MLARRLRRPRLGDRQREPSGCSTRSASATRLAGKGCPIRGHPGQRRAGAGRARFRARRGRWRARHDVREPRCCARPCSRRRARRRVSICGCRRARSSVERGAAGVTRDARSTAATVARAAADRARRGAIRRRARRRGITRRALELRSCRDRRRVPPRAAATRMSPTRSSIPTGPFAILPLLDDDDGHRSAIVWSVRRRRRRRGC